MKKLNIQIAILWLGLQILGAKEVPRLHDEYDPTKWPKAELKLSTAGTLKDIFDSGLRPYRHPGLENTLLEVKHLDLVVTLGSGNILPSIKAELINITPYPDGEIATIEGFTPKLTLDQAREEMLKWLPYGQNQRTREELDEFLKAVAADYIDFDDPYRGISHGCGIGWKEPGYKTLKGGPQCGIGFRKTTNETHPLRLYFGLDWGLNRPSKDRVVYRPEPIEPPPGYEHISLDTPEKFGPDSMADILRSKGVDIGDGKGGIPQDVYFGKNLQEKISKSHSPYESLPSIKNNENSWTLRIIAILLIILFLIFMLRQKYNGYRHDRGIQRSK